MARGVIGNITAGGEKHYVASTLYGTCATAAATAAKVVKLTEAITDTAWLQTGMLLCVKFTYANGAASPTLTIQNSSGTQLIAAKSIMRYGTTAPSGSAATSWTAGAVVPFIYDGTNWIEASSWDNNTTYTALSLGFGYGTCGTAAADAAKTVTLSGGVLGANGSIIAAKFTYANTIANPTLNVNSKGAKSIFWKGAALTDTTLIKAGDIVTFMYDGTRYQIIGIDSARTTVTQTATSTNADYEILFSETADNTSRTEGTRKNNNLTFNPSSGNLQATTFNDHTLGVACGYNVDTTINTSNPSENLPTSSAVVGLLDNQTEIFIGETAPADNYKLWIQI